MLDALSLLATPEVALFLVLGVLAGLAIGIIPGLGGPSGIAMLLPFTLFMEPVPAIAMVVGLLVATSGIDSVPAVLFGIPGTVSSQATVLDGHPMARKGQAGRAFGAIYTASMLGGIFAAVILTLIIPVARPLVLAIGSPELLMLALLGVVMTATLSGRSPAKGLLAGCLGFLIAMIGVDSATATVRWWFGSIYLYDGIPLVIIGLGLFALPEIMDLMIRGTQVSEGTGVEKGGVLRGIRATFRHWFLVIRTSAIGTVIGMIPGLGGSATDWFAYGHARSTEKGARKTFGSGDVRGVIGVDAATNAKDGGSMVPTLLFGVPGSATTAMVLVVLIVQGIQPGPTMVSQNLDLSLMIIWALVLANVLAAAICLIFASQIAKIATVRAHVVAPVVVAAVAFAAINASESSWDLAALFVIGLIGWTMKRLRWPRPPLLIGFVLGPIIEQYLFISVNRYDLSWLTQPAVIIIAAIILAVIAFEFYNERRRSEEHTNVGQ